MNSTNSEARGTIVLATVKGDVHDIGKNIVGVVLACNNYKIIDLGVMVPCETILDTAREKNADIIGLSGLITPSLDEMVHVASEMERLEYDVPLLIGGATTSNAHTAVKIEPQYSRNLAVYVPDASRSVSVATQLMGEGRHAFAEEKREQYRQARERIANREPRSRQLPYATAVSRGLSLDWENYRPPAPSFLGIRVFDNFPLDKLVETIDWTPFFITWELAGKFPAILEDEKVGQHASELYADAQAMLQDSQSM